MKGMARIENEKYILDHTEKTGLGGKSSQQTEIDTKKEETSPEPVGL